MWSNLEFSDSDFWVIIKFVNTEKLLSEEILSEKFVCGLPILRKSDDLLIPEKQTGTWLLTTESEYTHFLRFMWDINSIYKNIKCLNSVKSYITFNVSFWHSIYFKIQRKQPSWSLPWECKQHIKPARRILTTRCVAMRFLPILKHQLLFA